MPTYFGITTKSRFLYAVVPIYVERWGGLFAILLKFCPIFKREASYSKLTQATAIKRNPLLLFFQKFGLNTVF